MRASVQVRAVGTGQGRPHDLVGHGQQKRIDLLGGLQGQSGRPVGRSGIVSQNGSNTSLNNSPS